MLGLKEIVLFGWVLTSQEHNVASPQTSFGVRLSRIDVTIFYIWRIFGIFFHLFKHILLSTDL